MDDVEPIKIWKVYYPNNLIARKGFLDYTGYRWAEFDELEVVKWKK